MSEQKEELIKCSKCKSIKFKSLFKVSETNGKVYKTCIKCRERFKCNIEDCNYSCSSNADLQKHIKQVHTKIKDLKCNIEGCNFKCSSNSHLQQHIKQVHTRIKDCVCNNCDYKCSSNGALQIHIKAVHNKIKNFECNNCDYKCSHNSNLQQHIKAVHNKIYDFICNIEGCDFKCSSKGTLQQHVKAVHNKIKDIICNIEGCDFKCSSKGTLQQHVKAVHNKIYDFICNIEGCNYKCNFNSHLQQHIKICTGSRNISSGEMKVINCLEELGLYEGIDYIHNSTFPELTLYSSKYLRFDFRLINHKIIIEFDGIQHFEPKTFGGISKEQALINFQEQQVSDNIKDEFCKKFEYKMIRISYKQFPEILSILHSELLDIVELD